MANSIDASVMQLMISGYCYVKMYVYAMSIHSRTEYFSTKNGMELHHPLSRIVDNQ